MELERSTTPRGDIIIQADALPIGDNNNIVLTVNNLNIDVSSIISETIKAKDFIIEHLKKENATLIEILKGKV